MHPLYQRGMAISHDVIAGAIEVHKDKGPGLNEGIYEWCLNIELALRNFRVETQRTVRVTYKGFTKSEPMRFDLLVENALLIEAKSVERIIPLHKAQLLSYMKLLDVPVGLLINFNVARLVDGVSRLFLPGADR